MRIRVFGHFLDAENIEQVHAHPLTYISEGATSISFRSQNVYFHIISTRNISTESVNYDKGHSLPISHGEKKTK